MGRRCRPLLSLDWDHPSSLARAFLSALRGTPVGIGLLVLGASRRILALSNTARSQFLLDDVPIEPCGLAKGPLLVPELDGLFSSGWPLRRRHLADLGNARFPPICGHLRVRIWWLEGAAFRRRGRKRANVCS